jgi:hypothetical protein
MQNSEQQQQKESMPSYVDEPPPILGAWRRLYTAVLLHLAFWIIVFYLFTIRFTA